MQKLVKIDRNIFSKEKKKDRNKYLYNILVRLGHVLSVWHRCVCYFSIKYEFETYYTLHTKY